MSFLRQQSADEVGPHIYNLINYSLTYIVYRNTDYMRVCLGRLVLSIPLHLRRTQNSLPVEVRVTV